MSGGPEDEDPTVAELPESTADAVSVGSIAHILHTTFRDLFPEPQEPQTEEGGDEEPTEAADEGPGAGEGAGQGETNEIEGEEGGEGGGEGGEEAGEEEDGGGEEEEEEQEPEPAVEEAEVAMAAASLGEEEREVLDGALAGAVVADVVALRDEETGELLFTEPAVQRLLLAALVAVAPPPPAPVAEEDGEADDDAGNEDGAAEGGAEADEVVGEEGSGSRPGSAAAPQTPAWLLDTEAVEAACAERRAELFGVLRARTALGELEASAAAAEEAGEEEDEDDVAEREAALGVAREEPLLLEAEPLLAKLRELSGGPIEWLAPPPPSVVDEFEDTAHLEEGARREALIEQNLLEQWEQSEALVHYLEAARRQAEIADAEDAARLKEEGLLVKSQFPIGPSNLALKEEELATFGHFGSRLVTARQLLRRNLQTMLDRTQSKTVRSVRYVEDMPGYLRDTASNQTRAKIISATSTAGAGFVPGPASISNRIDDPSRDEETVKKRQRFLQQLGPQLSTDEAAVNGGVLRRMNAKLEFMRNPRHDGGEADTKARSLLHPLPAAAAAAAAAGANNEEGANDEFVPPVQSASATSSKVAKSALAASAAVQKPPRRVDPGEVGHFLCTPDRVTFTEYEVGVVYEQALLVRNVSSVSRRLRLLPPATAHFALERIEFAGGTHGTLAPGMAARCLIRFAPDSLGDYEDGVTLLTEAGKFAVAVEAKRAPPALTIPQTLDAGCCLYGNDLTTTFDCANHGGPARFRLLPEEEWPTPSAAHREGDCITILPFEIAPTEFELKNGENVDIQVKFSPQSVGTHSRQFVMVCDNCQVKVFTVTAVCTRVKLEVASVLGATIDLTAEGTVSPSEMPFDALPPGAQGTQTLQVRNVTPLELPFKWELERDVHSGGGGEGGMDLVVGGRPAFSVEPASGMLPAGESASFIVRFHPPDVRNYSTRATVVVQQVPRCSTVVAPDVPYTRELANLNCLSMQMVGAGEACYVEMQPPLLHFPGVLAPGVAYTMEATVKNMSPAPTSFSFGELLLDGAFGSAGREGGDGVVEAAVEPAFGELAAFEARSVVVTLTPLRVGPLRISLPCDVAHSGGKRFMLRAKGTAEGPRVTVLEPEVDFGLISVGGRAERKLRFVNNSAIPAHWRWSQVHEGMEDVADWESGELALRERSSSPPKSSDSSRRKSSTFGPPPTCEVLVSPMQGTLAPGATMEVTLGCMAGQPERLRTALRVDVQHAESQFVGVRGEVQAPRVFLDMLGIALGTTYKGVPVTRQVRLSNLSNLSADFEWDAEPPEGPCKLMKCSFSPMVGTLAPKGEQVFDVTFTPLAPGKVDTLFACNVKGMLAPLGFALSSLVKGPVMSYALLADGEEPPPSVLETTPPGEEPVAPPPAKNPKIEFTSVALFERRKVRLLMCNYSGIPTTFAVEARKYRYEAPARKPRPGTLLTANGEDVKYNSALGRSYTTRKSERRLDAQALGGGKGMALVADPPSGTLMPWENRVVEVTLFNDMPGSYKDDLVVDVKGLPATRLPVLAAVQGCPLSIAKDSVGLDSLSLPHATLRWGQLPIAAGPETKSIRIVNDGPIPALVRWRITERGGGDDKLVDVDMPVDSTGRVSLQLAYHEKQEVIPPFLIEPREQLVHAHYSATFEVTLQNLQGVGKVDGLLTADAEWQHPNHGTVTDAGGGELAVTAPEDTAAGGGAAAVAAAKGQSTLERVSEKCVRFEVAAEAVEPQLSLDKAGMQGLGFKVWSIHAEKTHESYRRNIVLTNRMARAAAFSLTTTQGPFEITRTHCLTPHPLDVGGRMFTLQPGQNITAEVAFQPSRQERSRPEDAPICLQERFEGSSLRVAFANGSVQTFGLKGVVARPLVVVAPPELGFGEQHVEGTATAELFVGNPSEVDAHWSIVAIPAPVAATRAQKAVEEAQARRAGGTLPADEPSVFAFDCMEGVQQGPTLPLDSAAPQLPIDFNRSGAAAIQAGGEVHRRPLRIGVTFSPTQPIAYKCRFRFRVRGGESFDVVLQGRGTLAESGLVAGDTAMRAQVFPRRLPNF